MKTISQILSLLLISALSLTAADKVSVSTVTDDHGNEALISQAGTSSLQFTDFSKSESSRDNSALIEQAGNRNISEIIIDGSENRIESRQTGNDNHININIAGSNNKTVEINGIHLESAVLVQQDGDNNTADITIDSGDENAAAIYQFGDKSIATILQENGDGNRAWIEQGDRDHATIMQSGNQNTAMIFQK